MATKQITHRSNDPYREQNTRRVVMRKDNGMPYNIFRPEESVLLSNSEYLGTTAPAQRMAPLGLRRRQ